MILRRDEIKQMREDIDAEHTNVNPCRPHWDVQRIVETLEHFVNELDQQQEKAKSPTEIMPRFLHVEKRIAELKHIIVTYVNKDLEVNQEWVRELTELILWNNERILNIKKEGATS